MDTVAQITTLGLQLADRSDQRTGMANSMGDDVNRVRNAVKCIYSDDAPGTGCSAAAA